MHHSLKTPEKQTSRCAAASCQRSATQHSMTMFTDNRSKLTIQPMMSSSNVAQLATNIAYKGTQDFTYGDQTDKVGKEVDAQLDPDYPVKGTDTTGADQTDLMHALPTSGGKRWVKGHLLNHDLGGRAIAWNLFPITSHANSEHYHEVEKPIKHWIGKNYHVHYNIKAIAENAGDNTNANGSFICDAKASHSNTDAPLHGARILKKIESKTAKTDYTRKYSKKSDKLAKNKYSDVIHGTHNSVARDQYGTITKNKKWDHLAGSKSKNVDEVSEYKGHETLRMGNSDNAERPELVKGDTEAWNSDIDFDGFVEALGEKNTQEQ